MCLLAPWLPWRLGHLAFLRGPLTEADLRGARNSLLAEVRSVAALGRCGNDGLVGSKKGRVKLYVSFCIRLPSVSASYKIWSKSMQHKYVLPLALLTSKVGSVRRRSWLLRILDLLRNQCQTALGRITAGRNADGLVIDESRMLEI